MTLTVLLQPLDNTHRVLQCTSNTSKDLHTPSKTLKRPFGYFGRLSDTVMILATFKDLPRPTSNTSHPFEDFWRQIGYFRRLSDSSTIFADLWTYVKVLGSFLNTLLWSPLVGKASHTQEYIVMVM
jgi:hypothetical protein